jgi:hypothetical protein
MAKVFSINDFRQGLDVRRTALTAPGGSLRILENAVLNQGGEIEKRLAFVPLGTVPADYTIMFGQNDTLHFFGIGATSSMPQFAPVPMVGHSLVAAPETGVNLFDVEAFDGKFQVSGSSAARWYVWYDGNLLLDAAGNNASGYYSRTFKTKMYRIDGNYLHFSGVDDPTVQDPASVSNPGAGFTNMAINDPEGEFLEGMEIYYGSMAIFARLVTQIWSLDPDPSKDQLSQVLRIGTNAPHSIQQFGTGDILFLSDSGVRSLKAQNINLSASVSDVGSAIDLMLIPIMRANPGDLWNARAIVQPIQGRYWLHFSGTIYVLSYFPAGNITAWSTFDPGFTVKGMVVVQSRIFLLDTNNVLYAYGGASQSDYDSSMVTVQTPHLSADNPTENKRIQSVDVMCEGAWSVSIGMLPNNLTAFELVANIQDNTYGLKSIPFAGYGTHFGIQMVHQAPGPATLAAIHLNIQEGLVK